MPIRKILIAIDGSDASLNASTYAVDLAKRFEAELIALYVTDPRYNELEIAISPRPGRFKEIATKVMEKGEKFVDMVKQNATEKKVSVKTDVIIGTPSVVKEIVEYAENNKVDMIVIGSRGMTGFKKLLLGNVSSGVVTYSHCPANFTFLRGRSKIISSANDVLNKYFDYLFMYHRLKTRIGTLPINWNSNRNHDCSWYILYDKETG